MILRDVFSVTVQCSTRRVIGSTPHVRFIHAQGLICREMLEFRDGMPSRRHKQLSKRQGWKVGSGTGSRPPMSEPRISYRGDRNQFNGMISAFTRQADDDCCCRSWCCFSCCRCLCESCPNNPVLLQPALTFMSPESVGVLIQWLDGTCELLLNSSPRYAIALG